MTVTRTRNPDIIVAGHLCLDMFPGFTNREGESVADIFRPGKLVKLDEMTFAAGGVVANTGIAMQRFGFDVGFVAKVGDDIIGQILVDIFRQYGNTEGIARAEGEASSYTVALAPRGIDRILLHFPGPNDTFASGDVDFELVRHARLFHFGYPAHMAATRAGDGKELARIFEQAAECGAVTSMDNSLPDPNSEAGRADWSAIYRNALPTVDIFAPSIEEALLTLDRDAYVRRKDQHGGAELIDILDPGEYHDVAETFLGMGCAIVGLKAGHNGWYLRTDSRKRLARIERLGSFDVSSWAERELWCPAFKVASIASAAGSGDASIAAFLGALLGGADPVHALKMANCAGYMNLRTLDAVSGLCSWEEMEKALPSLRPRDMPFLQGTDWQWNADAEIWER